MMSPTTFRNSFGSFELQRRPARHDKSLRAWDAADEYLLTTLSAQTSPGSSALVINDQFGALAVALHTLRVSSWNDSRTAHLALIENVARNQLTAQFSPRLLPGTELPTDIFAIVLWRIPKTLALFDQQLKAIQACTDANTVLLAGGMIKHLPYSIHGALQKLGSVTVLPAQKKARVFYIARQPLQTLPDEPELELAIPEYQLVLQAGPNVFAREKFDIGARFFIEQFARLPRSLRIADLGCGNGIVGIMAKRMLPWATVEFFDDSYQAVAAAEYNYRNNNVLNNSFGGNGFGDAPPAARFHVDDVFNTYRGQPFDLILCNPPFHQGHVIGDQIAWQMFAQSRKQLNPGGELWIVGNRHLQYHLSLKKIFGNCRQIAANAKFVVLAARA